MLEKVEGMARMGRPGLSDSQKAELWQRWKAGESLSDIGRALGKHAASIFGVVVSKGGIVPPIRRRAPLVLQLEEREEISRGIAANRSIRNIAASMGRAPSSVSREIARHGGGIGIVHPKRTSKHGSRRADQSPVAWRRDTGYYGQSPRS